MLIALSAPCGVSGHRSSNSLRECFTYVALSNLFSLRTAEIYTPTIRFSTIICNPHIAIVFIILNDE
jgi:hypothetical protein